MTPRPDWSPGHICTKKDPDFERIRYKYVPYCRRNVEMSTKLDIYKRYGVPRKSQENYTIDHIIPLSIGGSNHVENLWPEHKKLKACRQSFEIDLWLKVRDFRITQAQAVHEVMRVKFLDPCNEH
jgi:hypothetical protein